MMVRSPHGLVPWAMLLLAACAPPRAAFEIPFEVRFGDHTIACDVRVAGLALTDLRFYVHDVRLVDESGGETVVRLQPDSVWQTADVAMLDFEDGTAGCRNGSERTNAAVRGPFQDVPAP